VSPAEATPEFEALLRRALAPVEPPDDLAERMESALARAHEQAFDELESWELSSIRDPRNWARPAAALAVGTVAGTGLVLLRTRSKHKRRKVETGNMVELAERTLKDALAEIRRLSR
jgi:hypothetical protein